MFRIISVVLALLVLPSVAAAACGGERLKQSHLAAVPAKLINIELLDSAVRYYVNRQRCARGLSPLDRQRKLIKVTTNHARWMASSQTISHNSRVRGQRKLATRLKASRASFRTGGENLIATHRYQIENGVRFQIKSASQCVFQAKGRVIPSHSYKSLAEHAVKLWMASPAHRKNIMNPRFSAIATSVALDSKAPNCGKYYLSQNFIG